jgi:hypothetical protein
MELFNNFNSNMDLTEIHRIGPKFTWSNKQEHPIMATLDRVLMSAAWDALYSLAIVQTLIRAGFDHSPLLLILCPRDPKPPNCFRLEPAWSLVLKTWC